MKDFSSFESFALHLASMAERVVLEQRRALTAAAIVVEKQAKAEIGTYQGAVGPFNAWAPLAESTMDDRVRNGFTPNDPLLRTGEMADSITHDVVETTAYIGSESEILLYQDQGTPAIPPRPVLGPALITKEKSVLELVGAHTVFAMLDGTGLTPLLSLAGSGETP